MLVVCICSQQANKISLKALLNNAFFYLAIAFPPKAPQGTIKVPRISFSNASLVALAVSPWAL